MHHKFHPLGRVNKLNLRATTALGGVIGVLLSDGDQRTCNNHSVIRLRVRDRDFAEAFGNDAAKVLGKSTAYEPRLDNDGFWLVQVVSVLLLKELARPWRELKPHIEANRSSVARFLRSFSDGESSVVGRVLRIHNSDRELLVYIQGLLRRYFGIAATGPHKGREAGRPMRSPTNGKIYKSGKPWYYLYIRAQSLRKFSHCIGFTIIRKRRRLFAAIQ